MRMYLTMSLSHEQRWAIIRLIFGFLQMFGAAFALALILWTGVNVWSLAVVVATGLVTGTSLVLFRRLDRGGPSAQRLSSPAHSEKKDLERRTAAISKVR